VLSLYEYVTLNQNERAEALWKDCEFIANIKDGAKAFVLYSIYTYYVEVMMENDVITDITPFRQGARLEKYLNQINIADLKV
jgi:hypothetical protein